MKYLMVLLSFVLLAATSNVKPAEAEERAAYETNGQVSFYGTYEEQSNQKEEQSTGRETNHKNTSTQGTQRNLASGQAVLPNTGASDDFIYSYLGLFLWGSVSCFILIKKRKEAI